MYEFDDAASAHVVGSPTCPPSPALPSPSRLPEELPLLPPLLAPDDDEPSPPSGNVPPSFGLPPQAPAMTVQPKPNDKSEKYTRMAKV